MIANLLRILSFHLTTSGACELPQPEQAATFLCCSPPTATASGSCSPAPESAPCPNGTKLHICSDMETCGPDGACWLECKLATDS